MTSAMKEMMAEGSLEVKLPTNMDKWKSRDGKSQRREGREEKRRLEKRRRKKIKKEKVSEERKIQVREEVGKLRNTQFFQWFVICGPGGLKSRLAKAAGAHFKAKMYKTKQPRTTFGSCDVEKVHAVVAQSTFQSQNVQNTSASDHF